MSIAIADVEVDESVGSRACVGKENKGRGLLSVFFSFTARGVLALEKVRAHRNEVQK